MPNVISKIKQNSSDMNEIILAPCDAGYVQSCTGYFLSAERHECSQNHHIVHMNEQIGFLCCLGEDFGFSSFRVHVVVSAKGVGIC
jgi:hypothetical protein